MANPFQVAGADKLKPQKYAPLFTNRFFTGLWTQRNLLRDAATPYVYEKFYSASRYDSLLGGSNTEISNRLTLIRRPGHSVYNSQTFSAINQFYEFRTVLANGVGIATETIHVIADTSTNVYDATGPSLKFSLFTKSAGAGQTYFQSVGNTLYMGDGPDLMKWVDAQPWNANHSYQIGDVILDSNFNLQVLTGEGELAFTAVTVAGNILTLGQTGNFTTFQLNTLPGQLIIFQQVATATFLNGQSAVILTAFNSGGQAIVTCAFIHANYGPAADTGTAYGTFGLGATSGGSAPTWNTNIGGFTFDNTAQWTNKGSAVQIWGITGPTVPPNISNAINTNVGTPWLANAFFNASLTIIDTNNNIQLLTTPGTTGGVQPTWNAITGGTTADGSAVWTNQGTATRAINHAYLAGAKISVTFFVTKMVKTRDPETGQVTYDEITFGPYTDQFTVSAGGTSSATATANLPWATGIGSIVQDGTVTWKNIGKGITWTTIGATTIVSVITQIVDSNGNLENILYGGKSGGVAPTWSTVIGGVTTDGTAAWQNAGPFSGANTAPWKYAFAYKNSVTGNVSTASPLSPPIILAASSLIAVSGPGSPDPQVDTIEIYRTLQGGSSLLYLNDIPAPAAGAAWNYADVTADAGLNFLILANQSSFGNPPPAGLINLSYHLGRIFGSVGAVLYWSNGPDSVNGSGNEQWSPSNTLLFPSMLVRSVPTTLGLIVFTTSEAFIVLGSGTATDPLYAVPFFQNRITGLLSYNALAVEGSIIHLFTSNRKFMTVDPSAGLSEDGFPIGDVLRSYNPANAFVAAHEGDSTDTALYLTNGAGNWYRLNRTPAPETGMCWSPQATIVGGFSAVQSIETSPGTHQLLLGPQTSGPILFRDATTHQDNGSNFTASATIGNVVVAQPGQVALLDFITTDAIALGAHPIISVLLGEIAASGPVPFELLSLPASDPTDLLPSVTTYNDRWYFSSTQDPAECRHLQIMVAWPAENFANELLTYTLNGAIGD